MEFIFAGLLALVLILFWFPLPRYVALGATLLVIAFGAYVGLLSPLAIFVLIALFLLSAFYYSGKKPLSVGIVLALLCWALSKHWIPGFGNWLALARVQLSTNSIPFNIFLNYDKAFMGIALLLFLGPLNPAKLWTTLRDNWFIALGCIAVLLGSTLALSFVHFDFKISAAMPLWLLSNIFFVCMPEEVFFRGFIQKELSDRPLSALAVSSLLFGVYHAHFGAPMVLFGMLAGLFYGWIYWRSKRLEASIALHFLVNVLHFLFFTYPRG
jgi:membrane protease YdiL (CAAX protease family)